MQRIYTLPEFEERCAPSAPCEHKVRCLRFRANPTPGIALADYSGMIQKDGRCEKMLPMPVDKAP
jgi:hypothetical protein